MTVRLANHTTFHLGGNAKEFFTATQEEEAIKLALEADKKGMPLLILGGGSNLLVADEGFDGRVIKIAFRGKEIVKDSCSGAMITIKAGEDWDLLTQDLVALGLGGIETLSGIPGTVGAAPIQNIGAYGHELSEVVARVRTFDRERGEVFTFTHDQCGFAYRTSRFKAEPDRYLILDLTLQMKEGELSFPLLYPELADYLDLEVEARAPLSKVRDAVLAIRRGKGMVLDSEDPDTNSAGSFFTNPFVEAEKVPDGAPSWKSGDGRVKVSAAWLIEHSGIKRGFGLGNAAISSKHVLALTNPGSATAREVRELADFCQKKVMENFGIVLEREVRLVGFAQ